MEIGDIVIPNRDDVILHSGSNLYRCAIVANIDPFVMVSIEADMRWNNENPADYIPLCQADYSIVKKARFRYLKEDPTFQPIPDYGDLMTVKSWISYVQQGMFIDYDGFGDLATETECSDLQIKPSDYYDDFVFPSWATHIVWYNR